jgi:hypothetical protein
MTEDMGRADRIQHLMDFFVLHASVLPSVRENLGVLTWAELIAKMPFSAGQESTIRISASAPSNIHPELLNTLCSAYLLVPRRQVQYPPGSYTNSKRALHRLLEARGTKNLFVVS